MGKIVYCNDCLHQQVCKFKNEVQAYEAKAPVFSTGLGPKIEYMITCSYKITDERYDHPDARV